MVWKFVLLVAALMTSSMAQAVCYRDGKPYQTGAEVGGFICQADGTWRRKAARSGPEGSAALHFGHGAMPRQLAVLEARRHRTSLSFQS